MAQEDETTESQFKIFYSGFNAQVPEDDKIQAAIVNIATRVSTLPGIVKGECVERLIEYEAQPSPLLCLDTHSLSGSVRAYAGVH